ncbi:MAG: hypothetical protein JNM17_31455 [Archangium sp.]|nr:hypothetical protein [Archangium sp.]
MNPNPQGGPPQQQGFLQRNWKILAGVGCLVMFLCCGVGGLMSWFAAEMGPNAIGNGSARVDCGTPGPDGVDCVVKRTGAGGGLKPCWDLEITCANGGVMTGSACGELPNDTTDEETTVNMPVSSFSNQDGCDEPKSGAVKRLIVNPIR